MRNFIPLKDVCVMIPVERLLIRHAGFSWSKLPDEIEAILP